MLAGHENPVMRVDVHMKPVSPHTPAAGAASLSYWPLVLTASAVLMGFILTGLLVFRQRAARTVH